MSKRAGWGIVGTGTIARTFAEAVRLSTSGRLAAVGSRDSDRAEAFAREFGVDRAHGSYEELFDDPSVEFVYVATPHPLHAESTIAAARAGKHVLCEKPLAVSAAGAAVMFDAVRETGTFLMEGFGFALHPQTRQLDGLLRSGVVGELRSISASFGFDAGPAPANYLHRRDLAGGTILDNGCYVVAVARRIAGHTADRTFRDPDQLWGAGQLHPVERIDVEAAALLWFDGGVSAQLLSTTRTEVEKTVRITGSEGFIHLPAAYLPGRTDRFGGRPRIIVERHGEEPNDIVVDAPGSLYTVEADAVVAYAREGRTEAPELTWEDTLGNMRTLDRWREVVGVEYDPEMERPR